MCAENCLKCNLILEMYFYCFFFSPHYFRNSSWKLFQKQKFMTFTISWDGLIQFHSFPLFYGQLLSALSSIVSIFKCWPLFCNIITNLFKKLEDLKLELTKILDFYFFFFCLYNSWNFVDCFCGRCFPKL